MFSLAHFRVCIWCKRDLNRISDFVTSAFLKKLFFKVQCHKNLSASCLPWENLPKNSSVDQKVTSTLVRKNESDESLYLDGITGVNVNRKGNLRFSSLDDSWHWNCAVGLYIWVWQISNRIHSIVVRGRRGGEGMDLVWCFLFCFFFILPFQPYWPSFLSQQKEAPIWRCESSGFTGGSTGVRAMTPLPHYLFLIQVTRYQIM